MQYVGKVGGYVYNQWNSLNPATLLGAIDIIVVEQPDGSLHCSPWHVRFGKFQIIKPLQKKINLYVNDIKTDLPMKLGDGGEAFFVFETENDDDLSKSVLTSPVVSAASSPGSSPLVGPDPDPLDLNDQIEQKIKLSDTPPSQSTLLLVSRSSTGLGTKSPTPLGLKLTFEKARKITQKLNIPSKIDINGDMVLDMDGYKPNSKKNIDSTDETFKKTFIKEISELSDDYKSNSYDLLNQIITMDENGNIRILNKDHPDDLNLPEDLAEFQLDSEKPSLNSSSASLPLSPSGLQDENASSKKYFKTLRLTSEQLKKMNLHYGVNTLKFRPHEGNAQILSNLYLWKYTTPIVISDIDGTITKSDALGHVLNLFGRDWTHPGVANLFQDIRANGYNIMYLTARSVGQADTTRQYLESINQEGIKLPKGPVILSPDRTMAALRREVILKKPEVFKMACLNDIKSLYFKPDVISHARLRSEVSFESMESDKTEEDENTSYSTDEGKEEEDPDRTPFYAGFGNRITDAISYRSVKVPLHRIFTINPNGEVHMELLELAGYKSSYLHIGELVDHFFPPLKQVSEFNSYWNNNQFNQYFGNQPKDDMASSSDVLQSPRSPGSPRSFNEEPLMHPEEKYSDVNYWREPLVNLSDLSDVEDDEVEELVMSSPLRKATSNEPKSPTMTSLKSFASPLASGKLASVAHQNDEEERKNQAKQVKEGENGEFLGPSAFKERPTSMSSFTSPLKNFMMFGEKENEDDEENDEENEDDDEDDDDYTGEDDYTDDDYTGDDYSDDNDFEDNDFEDNDYDVEDDLDQDDALPPAASEVAHEPKNSSPPPSPPSHQSAPGTPAAKPVKASELFSKMKA